MLFGAVNWMHSGSPWLFLMGFAGVLYIMYAWWSDIVLESHDGDHTPVVRIGLRYGFIMFIMSEVMFFVAFFWAFFNASLFPVGGMWPPEGIPTVNPMELPLMMTLMLLLSGCTVTWAHAAILEGDNDSFKLSLGLSALIGFAFLGFQAYEYTHLVHHYFGFKDGIFPSTFYMATGFHGFHVLVGAIFLTVCWLRAKKNHFTKKSHFGFEAAAWYWHFVDVVWLFLFIAVYFWGSGTLSN
ncbi:MAG: cytochrome c oxidase subunit 3 [Alphaproteobacteria bacterium]|nr:MAG: cytochrome c oxidase subunit 3 [Alphaproteobacteria bacterium]